MEVERQKEEGAADGDAGQMGISAKASVGDEALALVAFNSQGEPAELAAKAVTQTAGLQALELKHVKACALKITGSDKPRKLPPAQAKAADRKSVV